LPSYKSGTGGLIFGRGIRITSQSLKKVFAMSTLRDLIKDRKVYSINAGNTVLEAARFMMEHNIGALPVLRDGELAGIFSERDLMNRVVAVGRTPGTTAVSEVMTPNPRAVPVDETVEECLFIMREFGFRHLPIVDGRELKGLVSLRDILMRRAAEIESQARRAVS
jgi:CBS domain-containing protein